jgi:hypothetical protein
LRRLVSPGSWPDDSPRQLSKLSFLYHPHVHPHKKVSKTPTTVNWLHCVLFQFEKKHVFQFFASSSHLYKISEYISNIRIISKVLKQMVLLWKKYKNYFLFGMKERKNFVLWFFFCLVLVYKYVRKTVVQHKTIKRIKFVVRKQSGFFNTFTTDPIPTTLPHTII